MKILHINSYFSTSGVFDELYQRQIDRGLDIAVYVPIAYEYPDDHLATSGSYTTVSRTYRQMDRWVFPIKHRKILKDLTSHYDYGDFDLYHAHSLFSNGWLAYQLHKRTGIPYIVAVRNADTRTFFRRMPWMAGLGREILSQASRIIFISRNTYNEVFQRYIPQAMQDSLKNKSQVIANGVADFWHDNIFHDKVRQVHRPLRIVSTGKIMALKGFVPLAQMVNAYSNHFSPAELHIIGPSWDQKISQTLKDMPGVTLHGPKSQEEILTLYREMDIFAMLSSPETFGLVYVEAMSQGLPVMYTKGEGFDSYFPPFEVGIPVDRQNSMEFCRGIDFILNHYDELVDRCLNNISPFQWDLIQGQYESLYHDLIN